MIDWTKYRSLFPHIDQYTYLNHASISPINLRAKSAIQDFLELRHGKNIEFWPDAMDRKLHFLKLIARLINADADNIALVPSTSGGLNILSLGLNWQKGDHILLNDFEFPANVIPFTNLRRHGVEIDFVHHDHGKIHLEDIIENIKSTTRVLSISFVEFMNGFRNEMEALGKICQERDIIFCVDAIQGAGALKIDVKKWQVDFLSTGGHKWLMWPAGLGFVYISPRIFDRIYPAQAGWISLDVPFDFFNYQQPFAPDARRFEPGGFNTMAIMGAIPTIEIMLEIGPEALEEKILGNTKYLMNELTQRNIELFSDSRADHLSGIVTFNHSQAESLFEYLQKNRIFVSLREGKIRVSPHFYNNTEDLNILIKAIDNFNRQ